MSDPKNEPVHDGYRRRMIRYLLGELPEAERDHLEEKVFGDEAYFAELQFVEDRLVDDYVFGAMSTTERQKFETGYLTSERRRQKVRVAEALKQSLATFSTPEEVSPLKPRWQFSYLLTRRPVWHWGLATCALVLLLTVSWFVFRAPLHVLPVADVSQTQITSALPTRSNAEPANPMAAPSASPLARTEPSAPTATSKNTKGKILLSVLSPGLFRDAEAANEVNTVVLPSQTTTLQLQLKYQPNPSYAEYRVTIETITGKTVLRRDKLKPVPQNSVLTLQIPSHLLAADDYVVLLSGKKSQQVYEELHDYNLRIRTK